ncbi:hypothetical protein MLD38_028494 [Melastoma candidum]|nr:hypothetical protein MLD38_028494 [Melastoma candidum]
MDDCTRVIRAVSIRINEFGERIELLSFADSVELVCSLRRLEACGGRVEEMLDGEGSSRVWDSIRVLRGKVGGGGEGDGESRNGGWSESARFDVGRRLPRLSDSVLFPSGRWL